MLFLKAIILLTRTYPIKYKFSVKEIDININIFRGSLRASREPAGN